MTPAEQLAEAILNAAGTKLANYMPSTKEAILAAAEPYARAVEAGQAVVDNTYVGQYHRPVNERSRYGNYEAKYYHRLASALRALAAIQEPSQ